MSAIPWLDAGIVPFSTLHYREDPAYWEKWFPADFITESFPGQFRNWFYSMLAMSTVLRREAPFKTILGYATVFGADGRPMHKSWGNAIEFDEAAERMGVDVMRWMYARQRAEDNILFGYEAANEARRELLVLWNVVSFLVTYARSGGLGARASGTRPPARRRPGPRRSTAGSCPGRRRSPPSAGCPWRTSMPVPRPCRSAPTSTTCRSGICAARDDDCRAMTTPRTGTRRSRALHLALVSLVQVCAPILPFLTEELYQVLVAEPAAAAGRGCRRLGRI